MEGLESRRMKTWYRPAGLLTLAVVLVLTAGCPRRNHNTVGDTGAVWVSFDVSEKGSGNPLMAYVWVEGLQDDFETLMGGDGDSVRFEGFGKTGDGYAVRFTGSLDLTFVAWSPEHELTTYPIRLKKGENLITIQLRKTEVDDERVPERIRLDVLERLPSEGVRTGS
jgi:hypothetical protein